MIKNSRPILLAALLVASGCAAVSESRDELQGVVELHERALGFELPGKVVERKVNRGDRVAAGQVLALLDEGLERPSRDTRAADLATAEAQLRLLVEGSRREDVRAAEAQLRGARAAEETLGLTARRIRELQAQGTVPQQQLDDAEGQLLRAKADREAAEQRLAALRAGSRSEEIRTARARVESARAALALADSRLARYLLRSPVAGVVLDTHVEPGEVVGSGAPIVTVGETQRPYIDLFVPEANLAGVQVGCSAAVHTDAEPGRLYAGEVEDVGRRTEFTPRYLFSPKERPNLVVRVRVSLRDPEERLRAGVPAFGRIVPKPAAPGEVGGLQAQPQAGARP